MADIDLTKTQSDYMVQVMWNERPHASGGGDPAAPVDASYVTLGNHADLTHERVLTAGQNIAITDGGANSTVTVGIDGVIPYGNLPPLGVQLSNPLNIDASANTASHAVFAYDYSRDKFACLVYTNTSTSKLNLFNPNSLLREVQGSNLPNVPVSGVNPMVLYSAANDQFVVFNSNVDANARIFKVNPTTLAVAATLSNSAMMADRAALDPAGTYIYTPAGTPYRRITKLNYSDGTTAALTPDPGVSQTCLGILVDPTNTYLYSLHSLPSGTEGRVYRTPIATMAAGFGGVQSADILNANNSEARIKWVSYDDTIWVSRGDGKITVLNSATLATVTTITITGITGQMNGIAYNAENELVYAYGNSNSRVFVINPATYAIVNSFGAINGGTVARDIGYHQATGRFFALTTSGAVCWQG